eukprot:TRINITY_DN6399_c0_g1_i1.p1 TRINITY_DN6399_c0_g1~~TRINITY_DN6399_c0_g1_i1.p1  ORF type:complete len:327 (+),score=65.18 TRINITY_DN6399_c0_g1_i1:23-1003(+)
MHYIFKVLALLVPLIIGALIITFGIHDEEYIGNRLFELADDYLQSKKGNGIYMNHWVPGKETVGENVQHRGVIILAHGFSEHSKRYEQLANFLVARGFSVHAIDHLGHGLSEGDRHYVQSFQDYVDDLEFFSDMIRKQYYRQGLSLPFFLLGHSMGAAISVKLAMRDQSMWKGVFLSSPMFSISPKLYNPVTKFLLGTFSTLLPKLPIPLFFDTSVISYDQRIIDDYLNDPHVTRSHLYLRTANELFNAANSVIEISKNVTFPFYIACGEDDTITPSYGAKSFYENAKTKRKTIRIYKGFKHELFDGKGSLTVKNDLLDWLEKMLD